MIKVTYNYEKNELTITGHAYSGKAGHDLICAGVSTLFYTLVKNAQQLEALKYGKIKEFKAETGEGKLLFKAKNKSVSAAVKNVFCSICVGFEMLAVEYPKNILYFLE